MTIYAALCFICSSIKFYNTGNKNVFLFHELVTVEVNAIYIAVFATLALFYFIQLQNKKNIDFVAIYMLFIFLIFLSSKTVCFIGCYLGLWYYINCSKTSSGIKIVSAAISLTFIMFSFLYVDTIKNRFLEEYETAFVDNSLNNSLGSPENKVLNISLKQAWTKDKFNPNEFFPGTAFRIVHIRFFSEIIKTKKNIYLGLGQDASEKSIKQTYNQYKLFENYNYFNFHNQYIQIFAELGILGFFVFLYMIFFNIQQAMRHDDFLHLVFASSTAIIFLTESMLCRQRGIVFFIVLYCIFNTTAIEQKKLEI
jgi:hypothetical protein